MDVAESVVASAGQKSSRPGVLKAVAGTGTAVVLSDGGVVIWTQPASTTATNINIGFSELTCDSGTGSIAFVAS